MKSILLKYTDWLVLLMCGLLYGCVTPGTEGERVLQASLTPASDGITTQPDSVALTTQKNHFWWHIAFRFRWPQGQPADLYLDGYIAHILVWPMVRSDKFNRLVWRVHRRAARDSAGHQFSFLFYSTPETAQFVVSRIMQNPLLEQLRQENILVEVRLPDMAGNEKSEIHHSSDPSWSMGVQRSWPYFAMGVSRMWLDLVHQLAVVSIPKEIAHESAAARPYYQSIERQIQSIWQYEGNHALLHHLNAIFGYYEIMIYERRRF